MCRVDLADDAPTVWSARDRRARKPHRCSECGREIEPGEVYRYTFMVYDGDPLSARSCTHCRVGEKWLVANCGGFLIEDVSEDLREHAIEYPALALPLLRLVAGMRRGWRRFDGAGLMPLPALPPAIKV